MKLCHVQMCLITFWPSKVLFYSTLLYLHHDSTIHVVSLTSLNFLLQPLTAIFVIYRNGFPSPHYFWSIQCWYNDIPTVKASCFPVWKSFVFLPPHFLDVYAAYIKLALDTNWVLPDSDIQADIGRVTISVPNLV